MFIKQLSVFVENKSGRLAEITAVLAGAGIDIRALSIADTTNFGILRIIVDKPFEAETAPKEAGLTVSLTSVLAIGIPDEPGGFAAAMKALAAAGVGSNTCTRSSPATKGGPVSSSASRRKIRTKAVAGLQAANIEILDAGEFIPCKRKSSLRPAGSFLPFEIDRIRRWGLIHTGLRAILNKRAEQPPEKSGGCS